MIDSKCSPSRTTTKTLLALRSSNPCKSTASLGRELGISRERARQILSRAGMPTTIIRPKSLCPVCDSPFRSGQKTCSLMCFHKIRYVEVACSHCSRLYEIRIKRLILMTTRGQQRWFCSTLCKISWLTQHNKELRQITELSKRAG